MSIADRFTPSPAEIDLNDLELFRSNHHHDAFRILRQQDPIHFQKGGETFQDYWGITRYADILEVSRQPEIFISSKGIAGPGIRPEVFQAQLAADPSLATLADSSIITMDPPRHVKMRRLVNKGFTPRAVNAMEEQIRDITNDLLDGIAQKGKVDFVLEVASQLPLAVICGMAGLDKKDWPYMFDLTNKVLGASDPEYQTTVPPEDRGTNRAARITGNYGSTKMREFFRDVLAERRAHPREDDLVTILLESELDGEPLDEQDILAFCFLLIVAGNETTRNAISGGLIALLENPDQKAKLLANPDLIDTAVEEICRWVSPLHHMSRQASRDTSIAGHKIREGERVLMWYPSANRDEAVFTNPDVFDITRDPNEHLAFGIGEHFCLGAGFARREIRVTFQELFRRFPDIELDGTPERLRSNFINGTKHLPVRFTPER